MGLCSATTEFTCCMKPEVSRLSTELHEAGACILSGRGLVQQAGWSCTFWLFSPLLLCCDVCLCFVLSWQCARCPEKTKYIYVG